MFVPLVFSKELKQTPRQTELRLYIRYILGSPVSTPAPSSTAPTTDKQPSNDLPSDLFGGFQSHVNDNAAGNVASTVSFCYWIIWFCFRIFGCNLRKTSRIIDITSLYSMQL